jgi:hypothetical protein
VVSTILRLHDSRLVARRCNLSMNRLVPIHNIEDSPSRVLTSPCLNEYRVAANNDPVRVEGGHKIGTPRVHL